VSCLDQLSKGIRKDTTVSVVFDFDFSVQSELSGELFASVGLDNDVLVDSEGSGVEFDVELFFTSQTKRVRRLTVLEFEGQYSHTGQVASVDSFETLSNDGRDTLEIRSLGSPISG